MSYGPRRSVEQVPGQQTPRTRGAAAAPGAPTYVDQHPQPEQPPQSFAPPHRTVDRSQMQPLFPYSAEEAGHRHTIAAKVLGVPRNAGHKTVTTAYRTGARKLHPDRGGKTQDFQVLNEAYGLMNQQ